MDIIELVGKKNCFFLKRLRKQKKRHMIFSSGAPLSVSVIACLLLMAGVTPILSAHISGDVQESLMIGESIHNACGASGNIEWAVTFGGGGIDVGHYVQQTTDGGYVITGYTSSYGSTTGRNVWLIRTDSSGNEQWNRTFGGANDDEGWCVQQTTDGGYIITGYTKSYGAGKEDFWLLKTDSGGNLQWTKTFGGEEIDFGRSVRQTADGGYIIAGYTHSYGAGYAWLIKTDASGNTIWTKLLGGTKSDAAYCVQKTSDGGYILGGATLSYGPSSVPNAWLVKTDSMGDQQWYNVFGGTDVDQGHCVAQTADGGYILAGETRSFGAGLYDMLLVKTDSSGNEQWIKTFGGTGRDYCYSVQQTFTGGYILAGYTLSYGAGGDDVWVVKTDSMGNEVWNETYGGTSSDVGYSVKQTTDGGYIVVGYTFSYGAGLCDVWLIKLESDETPPLPLEVDAGGPYEGLVGEPIQFIGSVEGGVPPYSFHWDFGDNQTADEQSPTHTYSIAGVYEAVFTVKDSMGGEASDTALVTVIPLEDTTPPEVKITKPLVNCLYLRNRLLRSFPVSLIIGSIDVAADASDDDSGVASVAFLLNGVLQTNVTAPPYVWVWDQRVFGRFTIVVEAFDGAGNKASDEVVVWKLF